MPNDVVDATEHLLSLADDWQPRKIDLGMVDDRYFVFACGVGIDATVVKRVDRNPTMKGNAGPYYYSWAGISSFYRKYLLNPVRMRTTVDGHEPVEGVTTIVQNSDPFTYFASRPIRVCEGIAIDDGTLSMAVLKRAAQRDMPTLINRLFSETQAGRPPQAGRPLRRRRPRGRRNRLDRQRRARSAPSRSRSTATTSASATGSSCKSVPAALTIVA